MKTSLFGFLAGIGMLNGLVGCAQVPDQPRHAEVKKAAVTGSLISRPVRRVGNTYDTAQNIHVIDGEDIAQSGESSLGGALRRVPFVRTR